MTSSQEISWKRIFIEATAIVASILIAFAIDAWWQDRTEGLVELNYLEAVQDDLRRSLDLLTEDEAVQQRQVEYLESLLTTSSDTRYSDELRRWIDDGLFDVGTYQPQISALRDLESSGQSRIIRNPQIRRALALARQRIDSLQFTQSDFQRSQQVLIDPFLVENFNLSHLLLDSGENDEIDLSVLGTTEFQSRVAFKIILRGIVLDSQRQVREAFEEALILIESELQ